MTVGHQSQSDELHLNLGSYTSVRVRASLFAGRTIESTNELEVYTLWWTLMEHVLTRDKFIWCAGVIIR